MIALLALLLAAAPAGAAPPPRSASGAGLGFPEDDAAATAACGNGRIDTRPGPLICAPCIPGRPCACGHASITEECDGGDLGGRTCPSLGFLGGALRCAADCRLDRSGCEMAARARFAVVAVAPEALPGRDFALARSGAVLAVVSTETGAVRLRTFDAETLAARGAATAWRPPATPAPNAFGMDRFTNAMLDPLWSPAAAALGGGFVVAAERAGYSAYTVVTFRATADGGLGAPAAIFPGRHPFFLVPGGEGALLGYWWRGVEVVRLGADARPSGEPVSIPSDGVAIPLAAAAFAGDGWIVATAAKTGDRRVRVTRVALDGAAHELAVLDVADATSLAVAADGGSQRTWIVYAKPGDGVFALPVAGGVAPVRLGDGTSVLAAEARGGHLVAWAAGAGRVLRAELRLDGGAVDAAPVLAAPRLDAGAAVLEAGAFHLVFTRESAAPALYLAR